MPKPKCFPLALALLLPLAALAQNDLPRSGQVYQSFKADLNRDGKPERIELVAYNANDDLYWGQLIVRDSAGKTLWQGPRAKSQTGWELQPVFGGFPYGVSDIQLVGDIDGDGKVELVSPMPVSDVRPTEFRVFRWNGKAFGLVQTGELVETSPGSKLYAWIHSKHPGVLAEQDKVSWIASLALNGKTLTGETYTQDHAKGLLIGKAVLVKAAKGYKVKSWLKAPAVP